MKNYKGLKLSQIEKILYSPKTELVTSEFSNKDYFIKGLDTHKFYDGRMKEGGNDAAENVLKSKYLAPEETGPVNMWHRVAKAISSVESSPEKQEEAYYNFINSLDDFKLIPGGRILHGAGRDDIHVTLNNCYVVGIKSDSIKSIYDTVTDEAATFKKGGGCGHNLSILRPENSGIGGTGGNSCGPVGFMELYSVNTNTIAQHGRRGALMMNISDWHPDISKFISIKNDSEKAINTLNNLIEKYPGEKESLNVLGNQIESKRSVQYANVSVLLGHEFMSAIENDGEHILKFPDIDSYKNIPEVKEFYNKNWDGDLKRWEKRIAQAKEEGIIPKDTPVVKEYGAVKARELWHEIIKNAHSSAEPGILFWDTIKENHNLEYINPVVSTNPCAEEPLPDGGCCNLTSVNLERMVEDTGKINWRLLENTIRQGVRFLDDVIDYNIDRHALKEQRENATGDRRIGLGPTGIGDMLVKMGIKYDSNEGIQSVEKVMEFFRNIAYDESANLAEEKGSFPNYNWEGLNQSKFIQNLPEELKEKIKEKGLRNGTVLTCAPVGSGAMIAEGSSGIEPIYSISYKRDVKNHESGSVDTFEVYHPLIDKMFKSKNIYIPEYVVEAHNIDPFFRVKMQGTIQKYIDASISSTINLPKDTPVETVADIYLAAYKEGLKGVTVYREGSRRGVLRTNNLEEKVLSDSINDSEFNELLMKKVNRERPEFVGGIKEKIKTPHGYNAFVGVNWEKDEEGNLIAPYESFIELGKSGNDLNAISQGYGRLISLIFKTGIPPEMVSEQLIGIGGDSQIGFGENKVMSLPDAIGQGIQKSVDKERKLYRKMKGLSESESESDSIGGKKGKNSEIGSGNFCSNGCGVQLRNDNGCPTCPSCGEGKCS